MKNHTRTIKLQPKHSPRVYLPRITPWLSLSGVWMEEAGFKIGEGCEISVRKNKLVITKSKPQSKTNQHDTKLKSIQGAKNEAKNISRS
jgi:toxic protein SymE